MESQKQLKSETRNEYVSQSVKLAPVTKKVTEKRLKWYGHVKRRDEVLVPRRMVDAPVSGRRLRGRQNTWWRDSCKTDAENVGLKVDDALIRTEWKGAVLNHSGDPGDGKVP